MDSNNSNFNIAREKKRRKRLSLFHSSNSKGFSLIELVVVLAMFVLIAAILFPEYLKYVEETRVKKDESAMEDVIKAAKVAFTNINGFDDVCRYMVGDNYIDYADSNGEHIIDEQPWKAYGSGRAVTITFYPDEYGYYNIANGLVNDMSRSSSQADSKTEEELTAEDLGWFYFLLKQMITEKVKINSNTYKNSSYTIFLRYSYIHETNFVDVYGSYSGTNLEPYTAN